MQDSYVYASNRLQKMGYTFKVRSDSGGAKIIVSSEDNDKEVTYSTIIYFMRGDYEDYEIVEEGTELSNPLRELNEEMQELFDCYFECEMYGTFSLYCPL